jgi:hypothetical protein
MADETAAPVNLQYVPQVQPIAGRDEQGQIRHIQVDSRGRLETSPVTQLGSLDFGIFIMLVVIACRLNDVVIELRKRNGTQEGSKNG